MTSAASHVRAAHEWLTSYPRVHFALYIKGFWHHEFIRASREHTSNGRTQNEKHQNQNLYREEKKTMKRRPMERLPHRSSLRWTSSHLIFYLIYTRTARANKLTVIANQTTDWNRYDTILDRSVDNGNTNEQNSRAVAIHQCIAIYRYFLTTIRIVTLHDTYRDTLAWQTQKSHKNMIRINMVKEH